MAEKAGVAYPYLIICELCELCEQMCRLSIFSGKCLYFQEKIYEIILKFAYIKNCLYLCSRIWIYPPFEVALNHIAHDM